MDLWPWRFLLNLYGIVCMAFSNLANTIGCRAMRGTKEKDKTETNSAAELACGLTWKDWKSRESKLMRDLLNQNSMFIFLCIGWCQVSLPGTVSSTRIRTNNSIQAWRMLIITGSARKSTMPMWGTEQSEKLLDNKKPSVDFYIRGLLQKIKCLIRLRPDPIVFN